MVEPTRGDLGVPKIVDRAAFQADVDAFRIREQSWEDSPSGWPQIEEGMSTDTRPTAQWPRLTAGYSDDLGTNNGRGCSGNTSSSE